MKRHSAFLYSCMNSTLPIMHASPPEVEVLVEIVYNMMNNSKYFLTSSERRCLRKSLPLLMAISDTRSPVTAKIHLLSLTRVQLKAIVASALALTGLL